MPQHYNAGGSYRSILMIKQIVGQATDIDPLSAYAHRLSGGGGR